MRCIRFVDRDMMMWYLGLGIGHQQPSNFPREDRSLHRVPKDNSSVYTDWSTNNIHVEDVGGAGDSGGEEAAGECGMFEDDQEDLDSDGELGIVA